jgi:hypothetical protein
MTVLSFYKKILSVLRSDQKLIYIALLFIAECIAFCTFNFEADISRYTRAIGIKPDWKMTSHGIWYYIGNSGTVVIAYSHPEARVKGCILHYSLIDAVRDIFENN